MYHDFDTDNGAEDPYVLKQVIGALSAAIGIGTALVGGPVAGVVAAALGAFAGGVSNAIVTALDPPDKDPIEDWAAFSE